MKTRYGGGTPELIAQKNIQIKSLLSEIETLKLKKKEALKGLIEIREWLYELGPAWNYFGDLERAKKQIDRAISNLKNKNS